MSEQKNKLIIAITIAAIAVILLGAVSFAFFPTAPNSPSQPGFVGTSAKPLSTILIAGDGSVNSTELEQTGDFYTPTTTIINQTIVVQRDNIVIDGSGYALDGSGIKIEDRSNVTIRNVEFTNASSITLNESSNCQITNNMVPKTPNIISLWLSLENSTDNIIFENNVTMGNIELMSSSNNTLTNNVITNALSFGITLIWSQNNLLSNNYFENVLNPIEVEDGHNVISENNIVNCDTGIRIFRSGNTVFGNNMTFADLGYHVQGSDYMTGIAIYGSNNTVYRNIINGFTQAGISIDGGGNTILDDPTSIPQGIGNILYENIIVANKFGIIVGPEGYTAVDNNTIYHNDFINNYQNILVSSPDSLEANDGTAYYVNLWDNGLEGNFYSDYAQKYPSALENTTSGIMTVPYAIDAHNSDQFPLAQPYMQENLSSYSNPFAGQTMFPYTMRLTQPFPGDIVATQNRYNIYVEFYTLPPHVTLQLNPDVPIANVTTTLRSYTFNLAEPLPPSTTYTATVVFGEGNNTQSYSWNFTTPLYS